VSRRLPAFGALAIGIVVLIVLFSTSLFRVGGAFEELTDGFRPIMAEESLTEAAEDLASLGAVSMEFANDVSPEIAGRLGMSAQEFDVFLATTYPSVAAGLSVLPEVVPEFTSIVDLLAGQRTNFETADTIPTGFLPITTLPWLILLIGVATIVVAILMLGDTERAWLITTTLGVIVVALSLLLSFLPKARAADDLNAALETEYTRNLITESAQSLGVVSAMGTEMQENLLPDLAERLDIDQSEMAELLGGFPATETALSQLGDATDRFQAMVTAFDGQLHNYDAVKATALGPIVLMILVAGAMLVVCGVWRFVVVNRRSAPATTAPD